MISVRNSEGTDHTLPLSVAIITKNEGRSLGDCLGSIPFAAQIVVVDSGSTDETLAIAEEYGCDIYEEDWHGFGRQKQIAIDRCREEWVLILDADERIPPETADTIANIIRSAPEDIEGYSFRRRNIFKDRWIRHLGWWPDDVVRLFRRGTGTVTDDMVHEAVTVAGPVKKLDEAIIHMTESDLGRILTKIDHYSSLGARQAYERGKRATVGGAALRAVITFFHNFLIRGGCCEGRQGLLLSATDAANKFFKYAKLAEWEREHPRTETTRHTGSKD